MGTTTKLHFRTYGLMVSHSAGPDDKRVGALFLGERGAFVFHLKRRSSEGLLETKCPLEETGNLKGCGFLLPAL